MIERRAFLMSLTAWSAAAFAGCRSASASARPPADVLIIRHAEEPKDGPHLNRRGQDRAEALIQLFGRRFAKPTHLIAAKRSHGSERSNETLEPLSRAIGLPIDERFGVLEFDRLASELMSGRYENAHVLVCWHRESMPDLARALGVSRPPTCPSRQYDHIWSVRFPGGRAQCQDQGQHLLPGDDPEEPRLALRI